jgi:hypothetical protein
MAAHTRPLDLGWWDRVRRRVNSWSTAKLLLILCGVGALLGPAIGYAVNPWLGPPVRGWWFGTPALPIPPPIFPAEPLTTTVTAPADPPSTVTVTSNVAARPTPPPPTPARPATSVPAAGPRLHRR